MNKKEMHERLELLERLAELAKIAKSFKEEFVDESEENESCCKQKCQCSEERKKDIINKLGASEKLSYDSIMWALGPDSEKGFSSNEDIINLWNKIHPDLPKIDLSMVSKMNSSFAEKAMGAHCAYYYALHGQKK